MLANYLVGLREGLEASLVVVVLVAHLRRTGRGHLTRAVWWGVAVAVAISLAFGALLTYGPKGLTFQAQEIIGGTLSIVAVALVTWMILWMATAARDMAGELKERVDAAVQIGVGALFAVAAVAVGREGLETALFLWAASRAASGGSDAAGPLIGALLGLLTAVAFGVAIYRGALKINLGSFFAWTGGVLVLIAAGILSYGVHDLQEAGVLPGLNTLAFDVSHVIAPTSVGATVVRGVFNISPTMTWLQVLVWVAYVSVVMPLFVRRLHSARPTNRIVSRARMGSEATASNSRGAAKA